MTLNDNTVLPRGLTLGSDETVVMATHPHWFVLFGPLVGLLIVFLVPFFFLWPLFRLGRFGVAVFVGLVAVALTLGLREYWRWQRTVFILTTRRLVYIAQRGFFDRTVIEAPYQTVLDVAHRIKGFWPTIFRYGSIHLQLAGGGHTVEIPRLPRPDELHQLFLEYRSARAPSFGSRQLAWWEQRMAAMSEGERREFFERIRQSVGEEAWVDFFRPIGKLSDRDEVKHKEVAALFEEPVKKE